MFVLYYVRTALPLLADVQDWPAEYMPGMLAAWLDKHGPLLRERSWWDAHAAAFVKGQAGV